MPLQSRTNVSKLQADFALCQNRLELRYLSLSNMHISCSDNVEEATKVLGLNVDNRPNWEVPKLCDAYFVIRSLVFLGGINYFPCHRTSMTHSCVTIDSNEIYPQTKKVIRIMADA